ncbi:MULTISPECIES: hypothetical protein [unclassified Streptosporangium]|uniref:hypothetical protein n=1 Tax=unclassified Streptosporangium TaxID=2632669 RepID=UPI002E2A0273|nr:MULTISPECIES: hypothetical protein [unclassified Streptosporangium]
MSSLEARYRRLLACYPYDHRTRHEEDMIGVLLAGSRPGQTRPHLVDMADLLAGAVRMHYRRAFGTVSAPAWRDAVAVGMALWPVLILTDTLARQVLSLAQSGPGLLHYWMQEPWSLLRWAEPIIVFALPVLAVALRHRGIATLGALAFMLYLSDSLHFTLALGEPDRLLMPNVGLPLLSQVVAVAVAFTRPARTGMSLISRRTLMLWMPFGLIGLAAGKVGRHVLDAATNHEIALWKPVPWLIIMAAAAGYAAGSVVGRRAALLLLLPVAALGDLGKLPSLPASVALVQIGCVLSAFAMGTMLARRPVGRDPAARRH